MLEKLIIKQYTYIAYMYYNHSNIQCTMEFVMCLYGGETTMIYNQVIVVMIQYRYHAASVLFLH